jgi:hypothetical protein
MRRSTPTIDSTIYGRNTCTSAKTMPKVLYMSGRPPGTTPLPLSHWLIKPLSASRIIQP